jgi:hypothetical protein
MTSSDLMPRIEDLAVYLSGQPQVSTVHLFGEDALSRRTPEIFLAATVPQPTFERYLLGLGSAPGRSTLAGISDRRTVVAMDALNANLATFRRIAGPSQVNVFLFFAGWVHRLAKLSERLKDLDTFTVTSIGPIRRFDTASATFAGLTQTSRGTSRG